MQERLTQSRRRCLRFLTWAKKSPGLRFFLTEEAALGKENKTCKIRLSIFGDDLFVIKNADSFVKAATAAIRVLRRGLKKKQEVRNELPEEITTTVDV